MRFTRRLRTTIERAEAGDGFFVVPLAAGGLDYKGCGRGHQQSPVRAKSRRLEHAENLRHDEIA